MKTLRLSRQAMDQIRSSRQWKASEKSTTTKVEKFEPIGDDDEVIFGDHNKSRNDLQIKTTELGNFPTQDRLDYMAANWFDKTGSKTGHSNHLVNAAFKNPMQSGRSNGSSIKSNILLGSIENVRILTASRDFKLPIKKTKSRENTCKAKQMPLKDLLEREQDNLFVDRIDRVERMKNTS